MGQPPISLYTPKDTNIQQDKGRAKRKKKKKKEGGEGASSTTTSGATTPAGCPVGVVTGLLEKEQMRATKTYSLAPKSQDPS